MDKKSEWSVSIGVYPGILFGARTYESFYSTTFVLYIPFIDIAFEVFKDVDEDIEDEE